MSGCRGRIIARQVDIHGLEILLTTYHGESERGSLRTRARNSGIRIEVVESSSDERVQRAGGGNRSSATIVDRYVIERDDQNSPGLSSVRDFTVYKFYPILREQMILISVCEFYSPCDLSGSTNVHARCSFLVHSDAGRKSKVKKALSGK